MSIRVITKLKAGIQDILFGKGTTAQTRNGTAYTINRVRMIVPVDTLADLKALPTTDEDAQYHEALMLGSASINDGSGAFYYWDAASAATPNDTTVVLADDSATGRWLRLTLL